MPLGQNSRAVFLLKPGGDPDESTDYTALAITSAIYHAWASCRSRQPDGWARTWSNEELLSAAPGAGAHDGHYDLLAMHLGHAIVNGYEAAGASADLEKCFDRIVKEVIIPIALVAGFPVNIMHAYIAFTDNITIYQDYALGIVKPRNTFLHFTRMQILDAVLGSDHGAMDKTHAYPRGRSQGPSGRPCNGFHRQQCMPIQHSLTPHNRQISQCIRVLSEDGKTWTFATSTETRKTTVFIEFPAQEQTQLNVIYKHKDLGGHLDSTKRRTGTTMTNRIKAATNQCMFLAHLPVPFHTNHALITTKILPMAVYGASTTPVNWAAFQRVTSAIINNYLGKGKDATRNTISTILSIHARASNPYATADPWLSFFAQ